MKLRSIDILLASAELEQAPLCTRLARMFKQIASRFIRKIAPIVCCFKEKVYFCDVFTPKAAKNRRERPQESVPLALWDTIYGKGVYHALCS